MFRYVLPFLALGAPAMAEDLVSCQTSLRGADQQFFYDAESPGLAENQSLRERLVGARGKITCPGLVTLRAFTPELTDAERAPFCLQWDGELGTYIGYDLGERDAWLTCRTTRKAFCERVNRSKQAAARWGGAAKDLAMEAGTETVLQASGVVAVQGPASIIGEQLVGLGISAVQGVGVGAALGAVAVTAVAAGGAIYVCSDSGAEAVGLEAAPAPKLLPGEVVPGSELPVGAPPAPEQPAPPSAEMPAPILPTPEMLPPGTRPPVQPD